MSSAPVLTLINAWSMYKYVVYDNIQQIVPSQAPVRKKQFYLPYMHRVLGCKRRLWRVKHAQGNTLEYHKCTWFLSTTSTIKNVYWTTNQLKYSSIMLTAKFIVLPKFAPLNASYFMILCIVASMVSAVVVSSVHCTGTVVNMVRIIQTSTVVWVCVPWYTDAGNLLETWTTVVL